MKLGRIQTLDWLNAYIDWLENKLRDLHEPCPGCGSSSCCRAALPADFSVPQISLAPQPRGRSCA